MPPRGGVSSALAGLPLEYLSALRSYRFPPVELRRLQEKKLRILVEHAFNRVPYYHTIMRDRGLMPNDFKDADDLRRLPLLTKQVILTGGPQDFIARGVRVVDVRTTSGTTGPPVAFRRGPGTLERIVALRLRRMTMTGVRLWEKAVYLPYYGSDVSGIARLSGPRPGKAVARLSRLLARPRDLVTGYRVLPIGPGNVEAISRMLVRYRPSILRARPSYLRRIARVVKGFAPSFQASTIFTEGEVLTRGTRADLEASFNAQVFDEYGSTEHSGLGNECRHHNGIHLNVDYFIFEFLARD